MNAMKSVEDGVQATVRGLQDVRTSITHGVEDAAMTVGHAVQDVATSAAQGVATGAVLGAGKINDAIVESQEAVMTSLVDNISPAWILDRINAATAAFVGNLDNLIGIPHLIDSEDVYWLLSLPFNPFEWLAVAGFALKIKNIVDKILLKIQKEAYRKKCAWLVSNRNALKSCDSGETIPKTYKEKDGTTRELGNSAYDTRMEISVIIRNGHLQNDRIIRPSSYLSNFGTIDSLSMTHSNVKESMSTQDDMYTAYWNLANNGPFSTLNGRSSIIRDSSEAEYPQTSMILSYINRCNVARADLLPVFAC